MTKASFDQCDCDTADIFGLLECVFFEDFAFSADNNFMSTKVY